MLWELPYRVGALVQSIRGFLLRRFGNPGGITTLVALILALNILWYWINPTYFEELQKYHRQGKAHPSVQRLPVDVAPMYQWTAWALTLPGMLLLAGVYGGAVTWSLRSKNGEATEVKRLVVLAVALAGYASLVFQLMVRFQLRPH